ncbi:MAG: hypothetical protein ACLR5Y_02140 [Haemophilus parainfluenzae]
MCLTYSIKHLIKVNSADGEGRLIDCKNILFMLTSNCGFDAAMISLP